MLEGQAIYHHLARDDGVRDGRTFRAYETATREEAPAVIGAS